jgi:hypothetical protein
MTTAQILEMNRPMKEKLFNFPGEIRAKKAELETARRILKEAQVQLQELEAEMVAAIAAEVNPNTGKAAFSNAEARGAELIRRKAESKDYAAAYGAVRRAEEDVNALQFDLERLYDEFRAYRYVVDLTARELALLASDNQSESREASRERAAAAEPY